MALDMYFDFERIFQHLQRPTTVTQGLELMNLSCGSQAAGCKPPHTVLVTCDGKTWQDEGVYEFPSIYELILNVN